MEILVFKFEGPISNDEENKMFALHLRKQLKKTFLNISNDFGSLQHCLYNSHECILTSFWCSLLSTSAYLEIDFKLFNILIISLFLYLSLYYSYLHIFRFF